MNKKECEKKWISMRQEVDEAIREGLTAKEFMELNDISRDQWYRIKPIGFKWHKIQTELNIKRRMPIRDDIKQEIPKTKIEVVAKAENKIAVIVCKPNDLGDILNSLI